MVQNHAHRIEKDCNDGVAQFIPEDDLLSLAKSHKRVEERILENENKHIHEISPQKQEKALRTALKDENLHIH